MFAERTLLPCGWFKKGLDSVPEDVKHAQSSPPMNPPTSPSTLPPAVPVHLDVKLEAQVVLIEWRGGGRSELAFDFLRSRCPCATCKTEREAKKPLLVILKKDPSVEVRVTKAKLVGNYAIQFTWSDGHDTGIFDFRLLRSFQGSGAG